MPRRVVAFSAGEGDNVSLQKCMRLKITSLFSSTYIRANVPLHTSVKKVAFYNKIESRRPLHMLYVPDTETFAANGRHYRW